MQQVEPNELEIGKLYWFIPENKYKYGGIDTNQPEWPIHVVDDEPNFVCPGRLISFDAEMVCFVCNQVTLFTSIRNVFISEYWAKDAWNEM